MNFKDLNSTQINTLPSLFPSNKEIFSDNFDLSYEENINSSKNSEENLNNKCEEELKINPNNIKNNKNKTPYNAYKITSFNFFILNKKNQVKLDIGNTINSIKIKSKNNNNNSFKRGRKRIREEKIDYKKNNNKKTHDKYSDDNIRKKCKNTVLKYALEFINTIIIEQYKGNIGHGKFKKELKIVNQKNKINSTVNNDKSFLQKTLKEIFSENISARFYNFPKTHNKVLIESLINEKDEEKKIFFTKIFNITFLECLKYFREDKDFIKEDLEGFKRFSSITDLLIIKHGKEYTDMLFQYLKDFQEIINSKKARERRSKKVFFENKILTGS